MIRNRAGQWRQPRSQGRGGAKKGNTLRSKRKGRAGRIVRPAALALWSATVTVAPCEPKRPSGSARPWKHNGARGDTNRMSTKGREPLRVPRTECNTHLLSSFVYQKLKSRVGGGIKRIGQSSWAPGIYNLMNQGESGYLTRLTSGSYKEEAGYTSE